jgi:hypothetical protein
MDKYFHSSDDAGVVVTEIGDIIEAKTNDKKDTLATKGDVPELRGEFGPVKSDVGIMTADAGAPKADGMTMTGDIKKIAKVSNTRG